MKMVVKAAVMGLLILLSWAGNTHAGGITAIHQINESPANFDRKIVQLTDITKNPTHIATIDLKAYVLEDNTGEIIILTNNRLPDMGQIITVRVRIENLAIINGEALGTTVIELQRYE